MRRSLASSRRSALMRSPPCAPGTPRRRPRRRRRPARAPRAPRTPACGPSKTTAPSIRTTTRVACRWASSTFCVAKTTAPPRAGTSASRPQSLRRWRGSSEAVGSSRKTSDGAPSRPMATLRRCALPTESVAARAVGRLEQVDGAEEPLGLGLGVREPLEAREQAQVLARREAPVQGRALRHPARVALRRPLDRALARRRRAGQHLEQRRLAGAVGSEQRDRLAAAHVEVDGAQRLAPPVAPPGAPGAQQHGVRHAGPCAARPPRCAVDLLATCPTADARRRAARAVLAAQRPPPSRPGAVGGPAAIGATIPAVPGSLGAGCASPIRGASAVPSACSWWCSRRS